MGQRHNFGFSEALFSVTRCAGSGFLGNVIRVFRSLRSLTPGLLSVAAPRLVEPDIHGESSQRDFAYTLGRATQQIVGRAWTASFSTVTRSLPLSVLTSHNRRTHHLAL